MRKKRCFVASRFRRLLYALGSLRGGTAVTIATLMALNPNQTMAAGNPVGMSTSFSFGQISATLNITTPVSFAPAGATPVYNTTLHIHTLDNTSQPASSIDLVAIGQAADANTLVGGILPAALIVKLDVLSGLTFQNAAADAFTKTGVRVTFLQDGLVEYALILALIAILVIVALRMIQPGVSDQGCAIQSSFVNGLKTIDLTPIGGSQGISLTPCNGVIP